MSVIAVLKLLLIIKWISQLSFFEGKDFLFCIWLLFTKAELKVIIVYIYELHTKTLIRSVFAALLFMAGSPASPQSIIPRFESLGVNNGLPHSSVYSITQDKKGFMWFGTPDGLCRYDGSSLLSFKYSPDASNEIINNFIRGKMLEDEAGNIWYSNESGIYKWDVYREKIVKMRPFKKNEFGNVSFQSLALDSNGSLWLFNVVYGIFEYHIFSGILKQYPLPERKSKEAILLAYSQADTEDNIWIRILSGNDPYFVFNKTTHQYSVQLESDPPHALFFTKETEVQAFNNRLVYKDNKSGATHTVFKTINDKKISFYSFDGIRDNYGRLWMTARGNGLFYYNERHNRFAEFHHDNSKIKSLPFDLTTCLYIDRSQNLWIGLDGGGVARLDLKEPRFNLFPLSEGDYPALNDYFTKCFYEDEKGRTWFGSHNNGLNILDHKTNKLVNYQYRKGDPTSVPGNIVAGILKDRRGNMWIGSSGGISLFDEKRGTFTTVPLHGLPPLHPDLNVFVFKMIQLKNGDLLAATLQGLVKVVQEKDGSYGGYYFNDDPQLTTTATDVIEMHDGTIYATVPGFGLYQIKRVGKEYILTYVFLNGIDLRSLRIDEKEKEWLWVATGKGLVHFNTRTNTYFLWNEKDGLANSYVYGSLEEANGNLWVSTNGGLSFINRAMRQVTNYTYLDGLQSNEFNTQAFYKSASGIFYFGGIKGFNWFKPGPVNTTAIPPMASITGINIGNHTFIKDSTLFLNPAITVPYHKNEFNFQFAALDYTRPEANKVQYRLQGWDAGWITTSARSVHYSNLLPGQYTFRMKASNAAGLWSKEEVVSLTIKAPYWDQTWFRAGVVALLLGTAIFITSHLSQQRTKRKMQVLERRLAIDAERYRISADMHDEIGSGITHIALLSELIQTQKKTEKEIKEDVRIIALSARRLVQTMSEIIWALNPQNETLENLLAYLREQSQQYFEPFNIALHICFPDDVPLYKLTNAERRNLYLVTKELLSNAMKHAAATMVELKLDISPNEYCFTVTDNGTGMSEREARMGSNGIKNLKKRMLDIGGTIEWLPGAPGTRVRYRLPL